jgi:pimeloyl-ACP methyl ester carboxylesterase
MKIAFEEHGTGHPIVLIHAFPLSRRMWLEQIEPLTARGFRVILPDLFGFGETHVEPTATSLEDFARELNNLLDRLGIRKAIIGGLSMGGYVAFNFYRLFPEKIVALVLADTIAAADTEEKRAGRMALIEKIKEQGVGILIEEMLPNLVSEDTKARNPALIKRLEKEFSEVSPDGVIGALSAMAERKDHDYLLKDITVPAALIFGEHDGVTKLENGRRMTDEMPDAELFVIKKAGHYSNLEQPTDFNRALLEFLSKVKDNARK